MVTGIRYEPLLKPTARVSNKSTAIAAVNLNAGATMRIIFLMILSISFGCKLTRSEPSELADAAAVETSQPATESKGLFEQELIVPSGTFPANHGSTVVELGPRHFMSCWFAGSREAAKDVQIYCAEKFGETAWTAPRVIVKEGESSRGVKNKFIGNPVLFKDQQNTVWLFYEAVKAFGHSASVIDYKVSMDNGKTFSGGAAFAGSATNFGHLPRNKPLQLSSGRFMVPVYKEFPKKSGYIVLVTPDEGKIKEQKNYPVPGSDHLQPSIVLKENSSGENRVFAYLRNKNAQKALMSEFNFMTTKFSPVKNTNIPNPNAALDVVTTADNKVLLVYNDSQTGRSPLSLGISDDGVNFKKIFDFETTPGEFSYPCLIRDQDGIYHLTYTLDRKSIKYVTFDDRWLATKI